MSGPRRDDAELPRRAPDIVGHSKRVWVHDGGRVCTVELVPTLDSFTYDRHEIVDGTSERRLDFFEIAHTWLAEAGVRTVFRERVGPRAYVADFVEAPPFEVIVKNRANGSTTRKYPGLFAEGHAFEPPVVKFDYRIDPEDQPIADDYLWAYGLPADAMKRLALQVNTVLDRRLAPNEVWDFCVVVGVQDSGALRVVSEVSPDCMRIRTPEGRSLDKDLFRQGATAQEITDRWDELLAQVGS